MHFSSSLGVAPAGKETRWNRGNHCTILRYSREVHFLLRTFFCKQRVALLKSTNDHIPDELVLLTVQQRGRTLPTLDLKPCKLDSEKSFCAVNEADSICDNGELKAPRGH